jgi:hypothetical protein
VCPNVVAERAGEHLENFIAKLPEVIGWNQRQGSAAMARVGQLAPQAVVEDGGF